MTKVAPAELPEEEEQEHLLPMWTSTPAGDSIGTSHTYNSATAAV